MIKTHRAALLIALAVLMSAGAASAAGNNLAFYLVAEKLPYDRITWSTDLNTLQLADLPFIEISDIESYEWSAHTMVVVPEYGQRRAKAFQLGPTVPIMTVPFVVAVDSVRVYMGVLLSVASSWGSTDVPIVNIPLVPLGDSTVRSLHIEKAGKGYDERSDPRIKEALRQAGVLIGE